MVTIRGLGRWMSLVILLTSSVNVYKAENEFISDRQSKRLNEQNEQDTLVGVKEIAPFQSTKDRQIPIEGSSEIIIDLDSQEMIRRKSGEFSNEVFTDGTEVNDVIFGDFRKEFVDSDPDVKLSSGINLNYVDGNFSGEEPDVGTPLDAIHVEDDIDLGIKHRHNDAQTVDIGTNVTANPIANEIQARPLDDVHVEDDIDLGLKHKNYEVHDLAYRKDFTAKPQKNEANAKDSTETEINRQPVNEDIISNNEEVLSEIETPSVAATDTSSTENILETYIPSINEHEQEIGTENIFLENMNGPSYDECSQYGTGNITTQLKVHIAFNDVFTRSSNRHDICYRCGAKYGIVRNLCDETFKNSMWKTCLATYGNYDKILSKNDRKHKIVSAIESLGDLFKDVIENDLDSVLKPSGDSIEQFKNFNSYVNTMQGTVIREWMMLLAQQLRSTHWKNYDKYKIIGTLVYNKDEMKKENDIELDEPVDYDNKVSVILCEDVLSAVGKDKETKDIELTCEEVELLKCILFQYVNFVAVREFGSSYYNDVSEDFCTEPLVTDCLTKH